MTHGNKGKLRKNSVLVGNKYGKLTVLEIIVRNGDTRHRRYRVQCQCGKPEYEVSDGSLTHSGGCRSCAKLGADKKYGLTVAHGIPLYQNWAGMRHRCRRVNGWANRGIRVCSEWEDFAVFQAWSEANGYKRGLSLDRINVDGNYEPKNCQWVTRSVNSKRARAMYRQVRIDAPKVSSCDAFALAFVHGAML